MDPNTPLVLAAARYASRDDAVAAFNIVWGARHQGEFDHTDVAVLTKDATGELQVERHDSTAKHIRPHTQANVNTRVQRKCVLARLAIARSIAIT